MTKKVIGSTLILFMLLVCNANLEAENGRRGQRMGHGIRMAEQNLFPVHMLLRFKAEIGLTDAQVKEIENIRLKHHELTIKQSSEMKLKGLKLGTLLKEEKVNRSAMEKVIREIGMMRTNLSIERIHFMLDVKNVLSKEQIQKIEELKKEMRNRRFKHRDHKESGRGTRGNFR